MQSKRCTELKAGNKDQRSADDCIKLKNTRSGCPPHAVPPAIMGVGSGPSVGTSRASSHGIMCLRVCKCACACARALARAHVRVHVRVYIYIWERLYDNSVRCDKPKFGNEGKQLWSALKCNPCMHAI